MITALNVDALALQRGDRLLFRDLSFRVTAGEAVALTGANGAGKTSLLRAVAGFIRPVEGSIGLTAGDLEADEARRNHSHFVGYQDSMKTDRSVRDELLFHSLWTGGSRVTALAAADRLGLTPLLDLEIRKLSAGQRRRLALTRLVSAPRSLWLLDEPLAPLDAAGRALFGEMVAGHCQSGGLVLAAVHDPLPGATRSVEITS